MVVRQVEGLGSLGERVIKDPSGKVVMRLRGGQVVEAAPGYTTVRVPAGLARGWRAGRGAPAALSAVMAPRGVARGWHARRAGLHPGLRKGWRRGVSGFGAMMPGAEGAVTEASGGMFGDEMFGLGAEESDLF